ncbi:MAG: hypothetical protein ACKVU1_16175 [bacterium]
MKLDRRVLMIAPVALAFASCGDGGGGTITPLPEESELSRLWPNEDGNSWTFDFVTYIADEPRPIPEAITRPYEEIDFAEVEALLMGDAPSADEAEYFESGALELRFDGRIATAAGPKQHIRDTLIVDTGTRVGARPVSVARQSLRKTRDDAFAPLAIPPIGWGYSAFEMKENWIGFYSQFLGADSAYTLIQEPIAPGAFFRHQINPEMLDATWEYGWVVGERSIAASNGFYFQNAIAVVYVIDWGEFFDLGSGERYRAYGASILYLVPNVGPVFQRSIEFFSPPDRERPELREVIYSEAKLNTFSVEVAP